MYSLSSHAAEKRQCMQPKSESNLAFLLQKATLAASVIRDQMSLSIPHEMDKELAYFLYVQCNNRHTC